ncbi:MAG TPA: metallopeptidase TldD-related protein [Actinomycetes bacterium]|nr:metallopeptidase TldD-related protein [Actinomycetes bacterium]
MRSHEIVESALDRCSVDAMTVICQEHSSTNLRWASNTLTTNGVMRSRDVTVVAVSGGAAGVASASVADADDLMGIVERAEAAARGADPAPDMADLVADRTTSDFTEGPAETSPEVFSRFAPDLGDWFGRARDDEHELFGFAEHDLTTTYLGNTAATRLRHVQPTGRLEVTGKSRQRTRSTWVGRSTRDFSDIDVDELHGDVKTRLGWAERSLSLDPGRYEVLLPPSAVADLLIYQYWTSAARDAAEGRTVFSKPGGGTRLGDRLTDTQLTMLSDPHYPGIECAPFVVAHASGSTESVFDNGLPLERTAWIDKGELAALGQTRHSLKLAGGSLTPMIDNLALEVAGADASLDSLIASTDRGLLLTTLWYIREVDPQTLLLTGITRDGVYLIENGEVSGVVNNFRFNESPVDMLSRVTEASATHTALPREWNDFFTRVAMPTLRVADFNMSTVSQAS